MKLNLRMIGVAVLAVGVVMAMGFSAVSADDKHAGCPHSAAKAECKAQAKCPVMGGTIDKTVYADHDGKRVYFCCAACIEKFNADPASFIEKMEKDGVQFEAVDGDAVKPATSVSGSCSSSCTKTCCAAKTAS